MVPQRGLPSAEAADVQRRCAALSNRHFVCQGFESNDVEQSVAGLLI
jgi:hypothetical protein